MAALDRALTLEPRNIRALLQKASLLESLGKRREAAMLYRTALLIPPGFDPPPAMRPALQHAMRVVEDNNRALEAFLEERLADLRARYAGEPMERFDRSLGTLVQKRLPSGGNGSPASP